MATHASASKSGRGKGPERDKKTISRNRTARHDYEIGETWEAGIELTGTEVKSIRERPCQITDSFCIVRGGELFLVGVHIHPYSNGGVWNVDPDRRRRLLMHRRQIDLIDQRLRTKGSSLVPLELYFDERNRVKLRVGLGKGKKLYDKRADMARRDANREIQRALKERSR
ncbi:SsrA-binding protein [Olsenella uli DSM 7084]|uniref:SsrA-binding protein n=1 Tax=Olsenella uli (strain ATCC 49627 / DSM 7084 / CCUG 31166 / CIP 109912 / JCM 12494 / LMG 11480 / NCIMB 702895 / VPI D76D-27C) TaxID=633147 RepID=E1QY21_OLSUV|nr:SsrA-binding protein SmpB [Olsenella uli]ADK67285.1 SsrA-binding protein [Olsenella uli DSM 7084]EUB31568.1 SsrA-binding protein [Olsenella uli MSTE5]KRO12076.1 SsrA-binding protein [Olsenella uli DSM 7084]MBS6418484.1 SsrA-binding protein SmpB [Olsenella uli]